MLKDLKNLLKKLVLIIFPVLVLACGVGGMVYVFNVLGLTNSVIMLGACAFLRVAWAMFDRMSINIK